jgi:hypothetical protein
MRDHPEKDAKKRRDYKKREKVVGFVASEPHANWLARPALTLTCCNSKNLN